MRTQTSKFVKELSRKQLEQIVINSSEMNLIRFVNILNDEVFTVSTNANSCVVRKIFNNIRHINPKASVSDLLDELESRGYYARVAPVDTIKIFAV